MKFVLPIVVFITLFLTGCGQKGPLYLPEAPQGLEEGKSEGEPTSQASAQTDVQQSAVEEQGEMRNE